MSAPPQCPFCTPTPDRVFHEGTLIRGLWDGFPVSDGHALLVTRRHVATWFDATDAERSELMASVAIARRAIEASRQPDGFNIGVNVGVAAGQTVPHLHVHVIPRYSGDVPDPRGGVRWVVPSRANYLVANDAGADQRHDMAARYGDLAEASATDLLSTGDEKPLWPLLANDLADAQRLDIAVAFVMPTGVQRFYPYLEDHLARGGVIRLVTGDYLDVSDPDALQRLLDLQTLYSLERVALRVFVAGRRSFHPKSYILSDARGGGAAYVGSSNLSDSALLAGIEWNYRVIAARDRRGFDRVRQAFEALFRHACTRALDADWLAGYRGRRKQPTSPVEQVTDELPEQPLPAPVPNAIQKAALIALEATRASGYRAGLVVLPTGVGKTWLAAFDSDRPEFRRILFVAHREEILRQALATFRRIRPQATFGLYSGDERAFDADVVFASVQTLGRAAHLERFSRGAFDFIVIDEFHHAAAATYRRVIWHFEPRFLLGLTATPERSDGGDLLSLCQENLVYRSGVPDGVRAGLLCPFSYYGVPDDIDYSNIPWRNSRFDEEVLTSAVATQARAANILEQWRKRGGLRTLAFCVSQRHADFMRAHFTAQGVKAVAVHSGAGSDPRAGSLERLGGGDLSVIFAVDMFNEGVDVPRIDTVMMLRPTESRVVWLQQFGRGLRVYRDKRLSVIDYIGNHRSFLAKARALLDIEKADDRSLAAALQQVESRTWVLPPGCEVTYDLRALDIMRALLRPVRPDQAVADYYRDFVERHGQRPTALETFHDGYSPRSVRRTHGSWFAFVAAMGGLDAPASAAFEESRSFLEALETTSMTRSYKMLVLLAMLEGSRIPGDGLEITELTEAFRRIAKRTPVLTADVGSALDSDAALQRLLEQNPIRAWTGTAAAGGPAAFSYGEGIFRYRRRVAAGNQDAFRLLVGEIVEWRIAQYLGRAGTGRGGEAFQMKVSHAGGRPILFLDRDRVEEVPTGWQPVVIDGERFDANFVKVAVNVVRRPGAPQNVLPEILRRWFGANAGRPGTRQFVRCERQEEGLAMRPVDPQSADAE